MAKAYFGRTCIKCQEQMDIFVTKIKDELETHSHIIDIPICINKKCPNYALLAAPVESMKKEEINE